MNPPPALLLHFDLPCTSLEDGWFQRPWLVCNMRSHTLPLSCILNLCFLFDGRQLLEIVFLLLYTLVGTVPLFFLEYSVLFFYLMEAQSMKKPRFALASTKIDRWVVMTKYRQTWWAVAGNQLSLLWIMCIHSERIIIVYVYGLLGNTKSCYEEYIFSEPEKIFSPHLSCVFGCCKLMVCCKKVLMMRF